ncbi:MAG TPA: histidine kinase dimerization/phospho-acceptor domain-containing protein, partial [Blastocatellia bacterium]|nr:histidine kinase dimerization/phospho-acceptor domain-containing protein [Blastocatellia bacterium]
MRSLFVKVFLSFWLTVVMVGITIQASDFMINREEGEWQTRVRTLLPSEARKSVEVLETSGKSALAEYLDDLDRRESVHAYFLDSEERPVVGGDPPPSIVEISKQAEEEAARAQQTAAVAEERRRRQERERSFKEGSKESGEDRIRRLRTRQEELEQKEKVLGKKVVAAELEALTKEKSEIERLEERDDKDRRLAEMRIRDAGESALAFNGRGELAAQLVYGRDRRYLMVLQFPPGTISGLWIFLSDTPLIRPLVIFLVGGLFCLWLTRHITQPLVRLRGAATSIADGRLETRVGRSLGRRRDEIARLGRDFDRMAEQIESLVTAQRRLLGDVSHELRSPLARLIVALSLLRKRPPEEATEYMDRIELEAGRLDKLIGQLLTLARIESGVDSSLRETFDLTNLVEEVAADADFEARSHDRGARVVTADSCSMFGMTELVRSAIENVVRNAIRHT